MSFCIHPVVTLGYILEPTSELQMMLKLNIYNRLLLNLQTEEHQFTISGGGH